ncbi:hypothetical protein C4K39_0703 [Pseudomonas sessilinigenes]|nr:hypothetical protein C4K39_0703 [Pseudomonas sessilinigenes]
MRFSCIEVGQESCPCHHGKVKFLIDLPGWKSAPRSAKLHH